MLHQVGVSFDLYYDARKHKIKILHKISQEQLILKGVINLQVFGRCLQEFYEMEKFIYFFSIAGPSGRTVYGVGLRPLVY